MQVYHLESKFLVVYTFTRCPDNGKFGQRRFCSRNPVFLSSENKMPSQHRCVHVRPSVAATTPRLHMFRRDATTGGGLRDLFENLPVVAGPGESAKCGCRGFRLPGFRAQAYSPKGPCTQIVYTLAPMYICRDYFKAKVDFIYFLALLG